MNHTDQIIAGRIKDLVSLIPDTVSFADDDDEIVEGMKDVPLNEEAKRLLLSICVREGIPFEDALLNTINHGIGLMNENEEE